MTIENINTQILWHNYRMLCAIFSQSPVESDGEVDILQSKLAGKKVIALGGASVAGKSSFLNALMGRSALPSNLDPSTLVPTYLMTGQEHTAEGINVFDQKVALQPRDLKIISYGFGLLMEENLADGPRIQPDTAAIRRILKALFFSTPLQKYENIAFLDTPGYRKPDFGQELAGIDESIIRRQLNVADFILWFVPASIGTIPPEDIWFIKSLPEDVPILFIISQADQKDHRDLRGMIDKVKINCEREKIHYLNILVFSDRPDEIEDRETEDFIRQDTAKILAQIWEWNCPSVVTVEG